MRVSTVLRICVLSEWVLVGISITLSLFLESHLPTPLQEWLTTEAEQDLQPYEAFLLGGGFLLLLFALAGSVGLLFLKRWGAWLYLLSLVIGYLLFPFMGPTVEHGLADAVDELSVMLSGLVLGLAFFSDALPGKRQPGAHS